ncbi:MAG: FtsW/RodA/SpoVE family cell cycle protein [Lachnospiraceae bacterium]|nr:FtsW/RodA/SpoVE family cell cycle protein [Lachnospiraceae bacterium]MDD3614967.1 FtsW/RodA/SpoVE family cell cycle protein [Lachnospiraceae bacterium]
MLNILVELSKYFLTILMILYTFSCFTVFKKKSERKKKKVLRKQLYIIIVMDLSAFAVMYLKAVEMNILIILGGLLIYITIVQIFYRIFYSKASMLLVNNMCMLLSIGFIIQTRLDRDMAYKQFLIVCIATVISFFIPVIIRKMHFLNKLTWFYAVAGILLLGVVLALAAVSGGAKLFISVGGFSFQPSELVKITYVFFLACMLWKKQDFKTVVIASVFAAIHVLILVASTDLGTSLVFFITYICVVYVATQKPVYAIAGLGGGCIAAVGAYFVFGHVRNRVVAWRDPFSVYNTSGYQIVQSLFAIGTGGWFGMGLFQGSPQTIPVAKEDFVFAAICEELGGIYAVCMILVCMSLFIMILNISMQLKNRFYKLLALGFGTEYAFQVFLTIGGTSKFIPMTGITLPLVSYGGSSILCTILMLAIIQGLYILREDEGDKIEKERQEQQERQARQVQHTREYEIPRTRR